MNPWVEKLWFHVPIHLPTTYILDDSYTIEEYIVQESRIQKFTISSHAHLQIRNIYPGTRISLAFLCSEYLKETFKLVRTDIWAKYSLYLHLE